MMSREPQASGVVGVALGKGCLAGIGMALVFLVISGLVFLVLGPFGLPARVRLLIAVASGPIAGTLAVVVIFYLLSRRVQRLANHTDSTQSDEPTSWDAP